MVRGKPLLMRLLERLAHARSLDSVVVATSTLSANDAIEEFCGRHGYSCFRNSEHDVLQRTLRALRAERAEVGVVVFGDGPLIDPRIVDEMVRIYCDAHPRFDFVGNDLVTTFPPGMEVEVFSVDALADAQRRCTDAAMREHGTLYLRRNPQHYRLHNVEAQAELRRPELELEVDTEADVLVIEAIVDGFPGRSDFSLKEIIRFMDANPELSSINSGVPRRWKQERTGA